MMVRLMIIIISTLIYVFYFFVLSNCNPDSIEKYNNKYMRRKPYQDPRVNNVQRSGGNYHQQYRVPEQGNGQIPRQEQVNFDPFSQKSDFDFDFGDIESNTDNTSNNNSIENNLEDLNISSFGDFSGSADGLEDLFEGSIDPQSNIGNTF